MPMRMSYRNQGYTLVELSIVLAIIGLIIGSIVVGQSVIRNSQLQSVINDVDRYKKAVQLFKEKYNYLPGDMPTAVTFWGATTANGDGNGQIGTSDTSGNLTDTAGTGGIANSGEWFLAWQHLSLASFIEGNFTGTHGAGGTLEAVVGTNIPASKLTGAGWTLFYYSQAATNTVLWGDQYGHLLTVGAFMAADTATNPSLSATEALSIDNKIDDGKPGTGKVRGFRTGFLPSCITNDGVNNQATATYNIANTNITCALIFITGF